MSKQEVLLISGTGGSYTMRGKDIKDSLFDEKCRDRLIREYYTVGDIRVIPERAFFLDKGERRPLLRRNQSSYPPLVTRTLEDILARNGISFHSIPCDTIWESRPFRRTRYRFVCLSTTFMWSEKMIRRAMDFIAKKVEYEFLIVGGHYSSIKYKMMLTAYPQIDYVIVGDGETALPQIIHFLAGRSELSLEMIPNLAYIRDGKLVTTKQKFERMEDIPKVRYKGQFDRLSYESVRGCAYGCKFCTWDAGIKCFRFKPAEKIVSDVQEYMEENGLKRIEVNDSTFLFPFSRIDKVLDGFAKLGVHWKAHARADVPWTDEMVRKLDESHCDVLQIGFESMNDRILKNMNKRTTAAMNRFTNEMLSKTRVDTVVSFMIGFPDETPDEFRDTWDYILRQFQGHFYLFVFEMEDKDLDLWNERDKYGLELYEDEEDCVHGGSNWKHNGMTSGEAFLLREQVHF